MKLFLKILIILPLLLFSAAGWTKNPYAGVTKDPKIIAALNSMDGTTASWAKKAILGDNSSGLPIKIEFKVLDDTSIPSTEYDARGRIIKNRSYIFINYKHQNAPPEALASLLSHEAVHQDNYASLEEETYAWGYEADVWTQMLRKNPDLAKTECLLTERLNMLSQLFIKGNYTTLEIRKVVYSNPGYKNWPVHSPGF